MTQSEEKKDKLKDTSSKADVPLALLLEKALLACMLAPSVAGRDENGTHATDTGNRPSETQDMAVPDPTRVCSSTPLELEEAVLACMPGAYEIPGPSGSTTTTTITGAEHVQHPENEEEGRPSVSAGTTMDIESEVQQQPTQTNVVSAYRVAEEEPAIVATPFKYIKFRFLVYGLVVTAAVALTVGLSVGLMAGSKDEQTVDYPGRRVSSVGLTVENVGVFLEADRYSRKANGREIVTTIGTGAFNWCEVVPCIQGGCGGIKVFEPGCCLGDDCDPSDKCGPFCPKEACQPSFDGCTGDAGCYECERGLNGEVLYRFRDATFNVNCLRTGVATGFNDKDDKIQRFYKWAIVCGFNVHGGTEWMNFAPGEYACVALRIGEGITKTASIPIPCQLIQLAECGCAPNDVQTGGLVRPPDEPCKTKQDCAYLCADAGEEQAKTLCEAFPGIEWWEGENPLYMSLFFEPKELFFPNASIEIDIDIYGE